MSLKKPFKEVDKILEEAVEILIGPLKALKDKKIGIVLSGGVDSSTLYALALKKLSNLKAFSLVGSGSQDEEYLQILERRLGEKIEYVNLDDYRDEVLKEKMKFYWSKLKEIKLKNTLDQIAIAVGFDLLFAQIKTEGIKYLLTAQGPDVLLAGYARYKKLKGRELRTKIQADLGALEIDKKRDSLVASVYSLKLINPYLTKNFIDFCLKLPDNLIAYDNYDKYLIRLLAEKVDLPEEIVNRPKKAFQYSTRLQKRLEKIIKGSEPPGFDRNLTPGVRKGF